MERTRARSTSPRKDRQISPHPNNPQNSVGDAFKFYKERFTIKEEELPKISRSQSSSPIKKMFREDPQTKQKLKKREAHWNKNIRPALMDLAVMALWCSDCCRANAARVVQKHQKSQFLVLMFGVFIAFVSGVQGLFQMGNTTSNATAYSFSNFGFIVNLVCGLLNCALGCAIGLMNASVQSAEFTPDEQRDQFSQAALQYANIASDIFCAMFFNQDMTISLMNNLLSEFNYSFVLCQRTLPPNIYQTLHQAFDEFKRSRETFHTEDSEPTEGIIKDPFSYGKFWPTDKENQTSSSASLEEKTSEHSEFEKEIPKTTNFSSPTQQVIASGIVRSCMMTTRTNGTARPITNVLGNLRRGTSVAHNLRRTNPLPNMMERGEIQHPLFTLGNSPNKYMDLN